MGKRYWYYVVVDCGSYKTDFVSDSDVIAEGPSFKRIAENWRNHARIISKESGRSVIGAPIIAFYSYLGYFAHMSEVKG